MLSRPTSRPARRLLHAVSWALALTAVLGSLSGCGNPSCVFGGNCDGGSGGIGSNPATIPSDGSWIDPAAPRVLSFFPSGNNVDPQTPVVIVFSETMSISNLNAAFELSIEVAGGNPQALPFGAAALVGDGRVLVLFPATGLLASRGYSVRFRDGVPFQDLTGQTVAIPANRLLGTFSTGATPPALPTLVLAYPPDGSTGQSPTGEIVAIFSRKLDAATVDAASFDVEVDGNPPAFDPDPLPLSIAGGVVTDTRVFRWRSLDLQSEPAPLPNNGQVSVTLSPTAARIEDEAGNELATSQFDFRLAAFQPPSAAALTSNPTDAIGIDQLGGPANLALEVTAPDAQSGDHLLVTIFGTKRQTEPEPPLIALQRDIALPSPFTTVTLTAAELDLALSTSPVRGRFADGELGFAFQLKRGTTVSTLKMLDLDPDTDGTQSPVLDTVAPTLTGLGPNGTSTSSYVSDLRDLTIVGVASESLRAVLVDTTAGDNDVNGDGVPPVAGSDESGAFVARPITFGVDAAPQTYSVTIFDRALNSGGTAVGTFRQIGATGPGVALPGPATIAVHVFDETTLLPIANASVFTHTNFAGVVTALANGTTAVDGTIDIDAATSGETIVTVVATGYDVFTVDGAPTDTLGIPLRPVGLEPGGAGGIVASPVSLNTFRRDFADSRTSDASDRLSAVQNCTFDQTESRNECPFGPVDITARELGAQSAFAVIVPANVALFSALGFLQGFQLRLPAPVVAPNVDDAAELVVDTLLSAPTTTLEERAIEGPPVVLSNVNYPSLVVGRSRVVVEARAAGVRGTAVVGEGVAFDIGTAPNFAVRSAFPGAVDGTVDAVGDELGRFVESGAIDADLLLRCEWSATTGARGGRRPRFSTNPTVLTPPEPPLLDATTPIDVNLGLDALDLTFSDVLPDSIAQPGLYRVVLRNSAGRRWTIWLRDLDDASGPDVIAHLPLVGAGGTTPLGNGQLQCRISAFAWPALDFAEMLWTDVAREFDHYAHSVEAPVTPP